MVACVGEASICVAVATVLAHEGIAGAVVGNKGLLVPPQVPQGVASFEVDLGVVGAEFLRPVERSQGLRGPLQEHQGLAPFEVTIGGVWLELEDPVVGGQGLRVTL